MAILFSCDLEFELNSSTCDTSHRIKDADHMGAVTGRGETLHVNVEHRPHCISARVYGFSGRLFVPEARPEPAGDEVGPLHPKRISVIMEGRAQLVAVPDFAHRLCGKKRVSLRALLDVDPEVV